MKRLLGLVFAGLLILGAFGAPAGAGGDTVKVWTQNLYIGADLTPVIAATTPEEFYAAATETLEQMGANLFPLRAQRLATEVALLQPDLIALQEVENITVNGFNAGPPFVDYLQALLNALALRGQNYTVAAVVVNLDLIIPLPFDVTGDGAADTLQVTDRDVILVRQGIPFSILPLPCSFPSADGCNYIARADLVSPAGELSIVRGFVGIEATLQDKKVFFVNTHLEQRILSEDFPQSALIQPAQAAELAGVLGALAGFYPGVPIILAGDFNSSPQDLPFTFPPLPDPINPPYQIISGSGFTDAWTKNPLALLDPKGLTCCQDADLANRTSALYERIDLVFVRGSRFQPWAFVTTRVPLLPAWFTPHWASDHGGVFAKLVFR